MTPTISAVTPRRIVVIAIILLAALTLPPYWVWLSETMWGVFVIYLWTRPSRHSLALVAALAGALLAAYCVLEPTVWSTVLFAPVSRAGFFVGWASLLVLGWSEPSAAFTGAAALPFFVVARWVGLHALHLYTGPTADGQMFLLDHALGDPAYAVGQWLLPRPGLRTVLWLFYMAVPLTLPIAFGAAAGDPTARRRLLVSWVLAGALSGPLYTLYPVAGPAYAFPDWPFPPPGVTGAPLDVPAGLERTGMPSLHLTWVLLAWYFAPRTPRWVRPLLALFVGTTVVATLGLGQHFLVDLIAAIPYTAAVAWLVTRFIRPTLRFEAQGEAPPSAAHDAA